MQYFLYIITNKNNTTLYIGRTENLVGRIAAHKEKLVEGFSKKYNLNKLVYYEIHDDKIEVAKREMNMKKWQRAWKDELIEKENPEWRDLYEEFLQKINA